MYDAEGGRHQAFYAPVRDTTVMGERVQPHERIQVEQSLKYSAAESEELWKLSGMTEIAQWRRRKEYGEYLVFYYPLKKGFHLRHLHFEPATSPFRDAPHVFLVTWGRSHDPAYK